MNLFICFLHSLIWFTTEADSTSRTPIPAEKSQLINHFGSFFASIQEIIDKSSLNRSIQNVTDYQFFLYESIKQLASDVNANFDDIHTFSIQNVFMEDINNMLKFVKILIDSIKLIFPRIFEQPNAIYKSKVNAMTNSLKLIYFSMMDYRPEFTGNFLGWIGTLGTNHPYAFCDKKTSGVTTLFELVKNLIKLEMVTFCAIKCYYNQYIDLTDTTDDILEDHYQSMLYRLKSYMSTASLVMESTSNVIYGCDLKDYVRDETYIELEGLIQPIFVTAAHVPTCRAINNQSRIPSCTELIIVMFHTNYFTPSTIDLACDNESVEVFVSSRQDRPCHGYLSHCVPIKSREICRNNMDIQTNHVKRYSWYKVDDKVFGTQDACPFGFKEKFETLQSVSKYLHHCYCSCHDNGPESSTVHVLNLRWQTSTFEDNKIVTGIKFTRKGKILSLQIKEGTLVEEGRISSGSENWMKLSNINFLGADNKRNDSYRDSDFTVLDENTSFDLDEIVTDFGYVVTGVKFQLEQNRVKLVLLQMKFDWKTGRLNTTDQRIGMNRDLNRLELSVPLINPLLYKTPNIPVIIPNLHYVKLKESSRIIDGSSTILPFFDAQKVEMEPSAPLSGIGLYHRGSSESAGFIALKLIGLNYSYLMTNPN